MSKVSYCDDCIHKVVCKHVEEVRRFEAKAPVYGSVTGPMVYMTVSCSYKIKLEDVRQA